MEDPHSGETAYRRISQVFVGDAIDDRTGEVQTVMILETLTGAGPAERFHFALPPDRAPDLARLLLSGGTSDREFH